MVNATPRPASMAGTHSSVSYPAGSFAVTGYDYEPWHYLYVGRDVAAAVHNSGLPLRQYLWPAR